MVYCGKPSKGCANCRKRKIRCDQTKPSCLHCRQAQFICPGYRDLTALLFRDQSQHVVQRVQRTRVPRHPKQKETACVVKEEKSDDDHSQTSPESTTPQESDMSLQLTRSLSISAKEQSICIFLQNYVLDDSELTKSHLTTSQMLDQANTSNAVLSAITSIGLAVLSNVRNASNIMTDARMEYASALRLTNMALRRGDEYMRDTTLTAVILLGMFEIMSCEVPKSLDNWQKHIIGASALLAQWGAHPIRSATSFHLFAQLRAEVIASCIRTQTHVPRAIIELSKLARAYRTPDAMAVEDFVDLIIQVSNLLADIESKEDLDFEEVIQRARALDEDLENWTSDLPSRWQYELHHISELGGKDVPEHTYNGYYYVYVDLWACNVWCYYRTARILVNLVIREQLLSFPSLYPGWGEMVQGAQSAIEKLSMDVCLSMSFALAIRNPTSMLSQDNPRSGGCLGGYLHMWTLYVSARVQEPGSAIREWIVQRLLYIGHAMGIGQALLMAAAVNSEVPPESLSVYKFCRSYRPEIPRECQEK